MTRSFLALVILCLAPASSAEDGVGLLGIWSANDRAADAIYGRIVIAAERIYWGGTNPYNPFCRTTYRLLSARTAATYPGNPFRPVAGLTFTIYTLELAPQDCMRERWMQFAIPSDDPDRAELVNGEAPDRTLGWHNFTRLRRK